MFNSKAMNDSSQQLVVEVTIRHRRTIDQLEYRGFTGAILALQCIMMALGLSKCQRRQYTTARNDETKIDWQTTNNK
jgi:hypothetical protein